MFYRRKIILALIELLGGEVEKLQFQKLLFLYSKSKPQAEYDFVPYKFGCYSFSAKADMNAMVRKGILNESENQYLIPEMGKHLASVKANDKSILQSIVADYGSMSGKALIKHTYLNYPFYAINSTIAQDVLSAKSSDKVEKARPNNSEIALFTIGYEGISLEGYLNKLVKSNVNLLIDVRKNPLSMKFGFSKTLLTRYCNSLNIDYQHLPELGIVSEKRKKLVEQADYDKLFVEYANTTLKETIETQEQIVRLVEKYQRVALTCFESKPCQCHRTHLSKSISELPSFKYSVIHM